MLEPIQGLAAISGHEGPANLEFLAVESNQGRGEMRLDESELRGRPARTAWSTRRVLRFARGNAA